MMFRHLRGLLLSLVTAFCWTMPAMAQTLTSTTGAGDVGTIISDTGSYTITGGTQRLNTLFHSFEDFSPQTANVLFQLDNSQSSVESVIGRVTGGNLSSINGELKLTGGNSPDLFLINPHGILFGPQASLSLPGSFLASTAEIITFKDELNFSASAPGAAPLLTMNTPVGLQYGENAPPITVSDANLTVSEGETLSLTGSQITLTNATLNAEQGRIELGGITSAGLVSLTPIGNGFTLDYGAIDAFGDISLTQTSAIDVSGEGAGNIHLQGHSILILDDSSLTANTEGTGNGGSINLQATESVEFHGTGAYAQVLAGATGRGADVVVETEQLQLTNGAIIFLDTSSISDTGDITIKATDLIADAAYIFIFIEPSAQGNGGDITLDLEQLQLRNAAQLGSGIFGEGNGSDITIKATSIEGSGETIDGLETSLIASLVIAGGTGNAGDIDLEVDDLILKDGAQVFAGTFGEGDAGKIEIEANSIELIGQSETFGFASSILASAIQPTPGVTLNAGQGELRGGSGDINIETGTLHILDGGSVASSTSGFGDAATINIQATDVEVIGVDSAVSSDSFSDTGGNGGDIQFKVERLFVRDGGEVSAGTSGLSGNAGNIDVQAAQVEVSGTSADDTVVSKISASAENDGAAGSVEIRASDVTVREHGTITVSSTGLGNAGNLGITTNTLRLDNQGSLQANVAAGDQGNIYLNPQVLLLRNNSNITTNATGSSSGGNITINAPIIIGLENSDIIANAIQGDGGNINITTQGILGLAFRDQLTPESDITASSQFGVNGTVEINGFSTNPASGLVELPSSLSDANSQVAQSCASTSSNQFIVTGRGGIPVNPALGLSYTGLWNDVRELAAEPSSIAISSSIELANISEPLIEAAAWQINDAGQLELFATESISSYLQPHATCSALSSELDLTAGQTQTSFFALI